MNVFAHLPSAGKTRRAAPNDAWDVVTLVVWAIDGKQYIANLAIEGCCAVDGWFANETVQLHCVGVDGIIAGQYVLYKHRQEQFGVLKK